MMLAYRVVAIAIVSVLAAFAAHSQPSDVQRSGGRVFAKGGWVEARRIVDEAGRLFANPQLLAARGDTAYVYDAGTQELIAILHDGSVRWRVGRAGKGPREFSNPVDLQVAPNGTLHVLDSDVSRITIVDPAGRVAYMRTIEERLHRIVPRRSGWWGVSLGRPDLFVSLGSDGRASAERGVAAPADIATRHILIREPQVAVVPNGGAVVGFVWSSRLLLVDRDGRLAADLDGPEHIPFADIRSYTIETPRVATVQRIDPKATHGARLVAANDSMAVVVFGGNSRDAGRVVDRYDLRSTRYVDSAYLTRPPAALRVVGNRLVALELDPAPALVVYDWRPAGSAAR
ncbi:MAG: hypothetical protein ACREOG_20450 [Gemmatimonadaceae bacterium]